LTEEKITAAVSFLSRVLAGEASKLLDAGKDPGTVRVIAKKTQDNTFAMVGWQLLAAMEKHVHADKRAFGHVQKESPPAAVHSKIVDELESARHEFIAARDTTEASRGYMGFALADKTLLECVAAIEQLTDRTQIVDILKRAYNHSPLLTDGPARPAVEHMRGTLVDLWKRLDPDGQTVKRSASASSTKWTNWQSNRRSTGYCGREARTAAKMMAHAGDRSTSSPCGLVAE
jgi:hypothetical protein